MINQGCASGSRLLYGIKDRQKVYMRSVALIALVVAAAGCQQTSGQTNAGGGGRGGRAGRGQTVGIEFADKNARLAADYMRGLMGLGRAADRLSHESDASTRKISIPS